jgi:alkanesulfonate monooxygenase SsuD/methylene tetrahydromethanopterin reductase-like flavin-dependent oxidoreductase (luciferase family)
MNLGVLVESEEGLTWERWRHIVSLAERLGFDSVTISDHLRSAHTTGARGIDPWLAMAVAAAATRRVRLGPLVSPITFYEPALVARMAESLQALSVDRFVLGLGLGWNADEHASLGIPFPPVAERMRRLGECIELLRQTLGERCVPVLIGGMGERSTLPLVARYADEWNLTTSSTAVYSGKSERLAAHCSALGRDARSIVRSVAVGVLVGRDAIELRERSRRMQGVFEPLASVSPESVPPAAREMGWVAGTPSDIAAQLGELRDAGVHRALLGHYLHDDDAALELIAADVMPKLRDR